MNDNTVQLTVTFDESANPSKIEYHHMTFGLIKFHVEDGVAMLDSEWDRLNYADLKESFDHFVTTGDVLRSVEQLQFIDRVDAPHHTRDND